MANRTDGTSEGCTFQWKMENISRCKFRGLKEIDSPTFMSYALQSTKWFLRLRFSDYYISIYLHRAKDCVGPEAVTVHFKIAILAKDHTYLQERIQSNHRYLKGDSLGFVEYENRQKVFITHKKIFLPEDTLTVQCTIWNTDQKPVQTEHIYARNTLRPEKRNLTCRIKEFSSLECYQEQTFKDNFLEFHFFVKDGLYFGGKGLMMSINLLDESINYLQLFYSIVQPGEVMEYPYRLKLFEHELKKGVSVILYSMKELTENKSQYLPNDVLTLYFDYGYTIATVSYDCEIVTPKLTNELQKIESRIEHHVEKEKPEMMTAMAKDLISMYNDQIFSDVEIRTSTRTFPAHKNILSARSPVFRRMLSNDMKEKISGHVDIDDLEDDTVHRMLLYMYTDTSDDLQYENASKLYAAADKYEILSLRDICASFMKDNLCPKNACNVLALADRHQDENLKSVVQDFILKHDKEVFVSPEWKDFIDSYSKLAADMMYQFTLSKM